MGNLSKALQAAAMVSTPSTGGGGGGGGTTNYNQLSNKPQINGITLTGNKSANDLGIESYDDTEIREMLEAKVDKVDGYGLSQNNFSDTDRTKLAGLADIKGVGEGVHLDGNGTLIADQETIVFHARYKVFEPNPTLPPIFEPVGGAWGVKDVVDAVLANQSVMIRVQNEVSTPARCENLTLVYMDDYANPATISFSNAKVDKETNRLRGMWYEVVDVERREFNVIVLDKAFATAEELDSKANASSLFVAEYNKTTAQELIAFIDGTHEPCAPIVVKRGADYYTVITATKISDTRAIIRTFATLSGNFYIFSYDITNATWANSNYGVQKILVSGTDIKTINGESLLGSGNIEVGGGSGGDSYTKAETDALLAEKAAQSSVLALQNEQENLRLANEATQAELTGFKSDVVIDLNGITGRLDTDEAAISGKQDALVSGTNIKKIGNIDLLGSGAIDVATVNNKSLLNGGNVSTARIIYDMEYQNTVIGDAESSVDIVINKVDDNTLNINESAPDSRGQSQTVFNMNLPTKGFVETELAKKQDTLTSGETIKTVGGQSLLGAGDILVPDTNYDVCIEDAVGSGNVVQIGTIKEGDAQQNLYQFYYRTGALPDTTTAVFSFANLLADYNINDFIDATGMTSNGIFIGNGRTDNNNRVIVQQFSKNNKNVTIRTYQGFGVNTALLKIIFKGTKA